MRYRTLGKTKLKVSEIGLGCNFYKWSGSSDSPVDHDLLFRIIRRAFDLGVTIYDTSESYGLGKSERLLAEALRDHKGEVTICTKGGVNIDKPGAGVRWNFEFDYSPEHLRFAVEKSLERLETKCIDVYLLHGVPQENKDKKDSLRALEEMRDLGKIRYYGVATSPKEALGILEMADVDVLEVNYNLLMQEAAEDLLPAAKRANVGVIINVPLAWGLLSGKYGLDAKFPETDYRTFFYGEKISDPLRKVEKLRFLERNGERTLAQAALKFVLANDAVSTTIPGAKAVKQVEQNVSASEGTYLTREEIVRVSNLYKNKFYMC